MLKVINNDIYLNRGEAIALNFKLWNTDGTPFILPPLPSVINLRNIAKVTQQFSGFVDILFNTPLRLSDSYEVMSIDILGPATVHVEIGDKINRYDMMQESGTVYIELRGEAIKRITVDSAVKNPFKSIRYSISGQETTVLTLDADGVASVLALTIRASTYDKIVMTKFLNMCAPPVFNGVVDNAPYGWNKFASNRSDSVESLEEAKYGRYIVEESDGNYFHVVLCADHTYQKIPYEFEIVVPLLPSDTQDLEAGDYTYDLIAYHGKVKDASAFDELSTDFPLDKILWKKELIAPHKFIIGDSHNA